MTDRTGLYPNFRVIIESGNSEPIRIDLRDCRIRVLPAGPMRHRNDIAMQLRGIVRPNGWLELRAGICDFDTGTELSTQTILETDPVQPQQPDAEYRRKHVLLGGKSGGGRRSGFKPRKGKMLAKEASIRPVVSTPDKE